MTDDKFFDRLRNDARALRFEGDDFMSARIAARVRERVTRPPTVAQFLAAWVRPIAASLAALVISVTIGLVSLQRNQQANESISSNPIEIAMAGETLSE
jgi:hypothetical protein